MLSADSLCIQFGPRSDRQNIGPDLDPNCTRGDQKVRGKYSSFLHRLINRAGITAHDTATHMQLIGYNMLDVSGLRASQLSSRQRYIAQSGPVYIGF